MTDWDLLGLISNASHVSQDKISEVIMGNNFSNKVAAQDAALNVFEVTPDNICKHWEAASKLVGFEVSREWGQTACLRYRVLNEAMSLVPDDGVLEGWERTRTEVWTRVMGYHRPVDAFNPGKQSEHAERVHFTEVKVHDNSHT